MIVVDHPLCIDVHKLDQILFRHFDLLLMLWSSEPLKFSLTDLNRIFSSVVVIIIQISLQYNELVPEPKLVLE